MGCLPLYSFIDSKFDMQESFPPKCSLFQISPHHLTQPPTAPESLYVKCRNTLWAVHHRPFTFVFSFTAALCLGDKRVYEVLPKIFENLNIPRKPLALRTCAARCLLLYLSTVSQPTCVFISARVSEFRLFPLHRSNASNLMLQLRCTRTVSLHRQRRQDVVLRRPTDVLF